MTATLGIFAVWMGGLALWGTVWALSLLTRRGGITTDQFLDVVLRWSCVALLALFWAGTVLLVRELT